MGLDSTGGMQTPLPTQQNLARGMDPTQGAVGAGGPGLGGNKGGMVTPAQPDFPVSPGLNPAPTATGGGFAANTDSKGLIARLLARRGG